MISDTTIEGLKQIDAMIKEAEAEIRVRQRRMQELVPRKKAIETECQEKFKCSPTELPALQEKNVQEIETETTLLKQEMSQFIEDTEE